MADFEVVRRGPPAAPTAAGARRPPPAAQTDAVDLEDGTVIYSLL